MRVSGSPFETWSIQKIYDPKNLNIYINIELTAE